MAAIQRLMGILLAKLQRAGPCISLTRPRLRTIEHVFRLGPVPADPHRKRLASKFPSVRSASLTASWASGGILELLAAAPAAPGHLIWVPIQDGRPLDWSMVASRCVTFAGKWRASTVASFGLRGTQS